jgi:hypothetical protein
MSALSALRTKAADKYPSYDMDLEDGQSPAVLKNIMFLDKEELQLFSASQKRLKDDDENDDLEATRAELISLIAGVSSDKARVAEKLEAEALAVIVLVFEEYAGSLSEDATKS